MERHGRPRYRLRDGNDQVVTVSELVEEAPMEDRPVRLNWSVEDEEQASAGRWPGRSGGAGEWPTGVLSKG